MIHRLALGCLLLAVSGAVSAQSGIVVIGLPGIVVENPPPPGEIQSPSFDPFFPTVAPVSINAAAHVAVDARPAFPQPLDPGAMLYGEQPILTIEEDGVRLPEQRLDTVLH